MRFHRNIKILRGQLDAAPFLMVFFLVLLFAMLSVRTYTPGVQIELPLASDVPGWDRPSVSVTVDPQGRLYFDHQIMDQAGLLKQLKARKTSTPEPLALIIYADREVSYDTLVQVAELARSAGIQQALLATMPRLYDREPGFIIPSR